MDANTIEMANSIARAPTKTWIAYLDTCRLPTQGKEEPTCRLMIVRDKANHTTVSLFINRPIQPQEDLIIEYGGPYWQIVWNHLSLDQQKQIKIQYPGLTLLAPSNTIGAPKPEDLQSTGA
jgi:hypothetical protein